jgi:hypothetical protein
MSTLGHKQALSDISASRADGLMSTVSSFAFSSFRHLGRPFFLLILRSAQHPHQAISAKLSTPQCPKQTFGTSIN